MIANVLKARLAAREPAYVMTVRFARSVEIAPIAAATGHHGLYVDLQHSALSLDTTSQICVAALGAGITPLVRTPDLDPALIGRVLDGGALGLIAPDVQTAEAAASLVRAARFPPRGTRSAIAASVQAGFRALPGAVLARALDDATMIITMLESPAAVAGAGAIAAVDGVDALFIGTNDLANALGLPGELGHPRIRELYRHAIAEAARHGKPLLVGGIRDAALLAAYVAMGAAPVGFTGNDYGFLIDGARRQIDAMTAALQRK